MSSNSGPLSGIVVLDLSHVYAAPYTTLLMAMAGARVIKVEPPPDGEHLRKRGSIAAPRYAFAMLNSNKESITLNLKHPEGPETLKELVRSADVLVENFRPGVLDRLDLGWEVLHETNPRLVYASTSGYGSSGPYKDLPAMDLSVQAMSGIVDGTGHPDGEPVKAGIAVADFTAGIHLYGAITSALLQRERTGCGSRVEVSMLESIFPMLMSSLSRFYATGEETPRTGNRHPGLSVAPYNLYKSLDGYVVVICESDQHWRVLCDVMGRPELGRDPRFATTKDRVERIDTVDELVREWCSERSSDEAFRTLGDAGLPSAPARGLSGVAYDEHLLHREFLQRIEHPELGEIMALTGSLRFIDSGVPEIRPSRRLGEDTETVISSLTDWDAERINEAKSTGLFG